MWGIESDEFITWDAEMKNSSKQHRYVLFAHYGNEEIENVQALCFNLKWQAHTQTPQQNWTIWVAL